jgi:hypothetical protein
MAEVAVPRQMFIEILSLIARLREPPGASMTENVVRSVGRRCRVRLGGPV